MKTCKSCQLPDREYYSPLHTVCKECHRAKMTANYQARKDDPVFMETVRGRQSNRRSKSAYMATYSAKYPEKIAAKQACKGIAREPGTELHHWSYLPEHWRDVIPLSVMHHGIAHRYIIYDQERGMYRTREGVLLDSKELHFEHINRYMA